MKTYIIHVSDNTLRKKHIEGQIKGRNLDTHYITEGDKKDLSEAVLTTYFKDRMDVVSAGTSCAYKHILAYEKIAASKDEMALILEDDIYLYTDFDLSLKKFVDDIKSQKIENFLISIEDSLLRYVEKSKRAKGRLIYPKATGRAAGAYLIDKKAAINILKKIKADKVTLPIDLYHNVCSKENVIKFYWSHPTICCQGSINGKIRSDIDNRAGSFTRVIAFNAQRIYKKALYQLR